MGTSPIDTVSQRLQLTALELHAGFVSGAAGIAPPHSLFSPATPRSVLESVIAEPLRAGPCVVEFSGGRDSSLVLAVAVEVARREGLPLPTAVILRHPGVPDAEESHWQKLVLDHLDAPAEVIEVERGASDVSGALAVSRLMRHGPVFPAPSAVRAALLGPAVGGRTVLTGQGGDEMLGTSRITLFTAHVVRRRRPHRAALRSMAREVMPRPVRRAAIRRRLDQRDLAPWLRPDAREQVLASALDDEVAAAWDWRRACRQHLDSRMWTLGFQTVAAVSADEGFARIHPLTDPRFVAALGRRFGPWGPVSRTATMRLLAADLLPEAVLTRTTKARFDRVYAGDGIARFAAQWDGSGVDTDLVDPDVLRQAWLSDRIHWASLLPLQLAMQEAVARGWQPDGDPGDLA